MTETLLAEFQMQVDEWTLLPGGKGAFEVELDGELVYSKLALGRHPTVEELRAAMIERLPQEQAS